MKKRVKLTPVRAMLLSVLFELVRDGEFVSEFSAEKIVYFLQRFGAKGTFKLKFQPNFYGPYSGKVKRVLYYCSIRNKTLFTNSKFINIAIQHIEKHLGCMVPLMW